MSKREYNERYRLTHKDAYAGYQRKYYRANNKRILAQRAVQRALQLGLIESGPCAICGDTTKPLHMVHDDYDVPLEVNWLCGDCLKGIEDDVATVEETLSPYVWGDPITFRGRDYSDE